MDRTAVALTLISELSRAPTISHAIGLFAQGVEPFGVRAYAGAVLAGQTGRMENVVVPNHPDEWAEFYRGRQALAFDPAPCTSPKGEAFFWRDPPEAADRRERGLEHGFVVARLAPGLSEPGWTEVEQGVVKLFCNILMSRVLHLREMQLSPEVGKLSQREAEVLNHAARGRTDKQIALVIGVTPGTVHTYWKDIRRKLSAHDRANAVALGLWSRQIAL